jgi:hypothetical protein
MRERERELRIIPNVQNRHQIDSTYSEDHHVWSSGNAMCSPFKLCSRELVINRVKSGA